MVGLPSLHALRVFESVARLGHLGAASAELHITTGAVSHQLRLLQEQLNVNLFEKKGRRLALTAKGEHLQKCMARALLGIGDGVRDIRADKLEVTKETTLRVSLPPTLSATWLSPRLFQFLTDHRHIRLRVDAKSYFEEVDWKRTDAAIVYGNPPWPGFWWRMLHGIRLTPVCSPQLLRGPNAIRTAADVVAHRLLHEDDGSEWKRWLAAARVSYPGDPDVLFVDFGMVLQAARDGQGVALVDDVLSSRDLDEGTLVQPLSLSVPAEKNYHVVCTEEKLADPSLSSFVEWLIEQSLPENLTFNGVDASSV